jgi:hypothetical protein
VEERDQGQESKKSADGTGCLKTMLSLIVPHLENYNQKILDQRYNLYQDHSNEPQNSKSIQAFQLYLMMSKDKTVVLHQEHPEDES